MNIENLEQIIKMVEGSDLTELDLEVGDFKLKLKRMQSGSQAIAPVQIATPFLQPTTVPAACPLPTKPAEEKGICYIKAPMVGTFYQSPNPDSPVFVKKGDKVSNDTVVCILEAMKVMNEIHAECSGEILEILGANGCPVEYGQALFKVKLDTV